MRPQTRAGTLTGVILAGGRARRMGGRDKGLLSLAGRPMIEYVIEALRPQVDTLLINANRNREAYAGYGFSVVPDDTSDYPGPLAGMAAAMAAAAAGSILTVPCDGPWLPPDLARRLEAGRVAQDVPICMAHDGHRAQPVFALLDRDLLPSLREYLARGGRKIDLWYAQHGAATADFSDCPEVFINVNTPEDSAEVAARLAGARG